MTTHAPLPDSIATSVGDAQRAASNPRASVWVSAAAGSGKTKVLADRVTRLLLDNVRPEKILCLTFTRAAAAEMSIRLTQRLSHWATCEEAMLKKELEDLQGCEVDSKMMDIARRLFAFVLACPGGMRIQTIHGFAQEILRRFPLEAGLAPHFTVMEEADANALWREAFEDLLENIAKGEESEAGEAFSQLVAKMAEGTLVDMIKETRGHEPRLREAIARHGGFDGMIHALRSSLGFGPDDTVELLRRRAVREGAFDHEALLCASRVISEKGTGDFTPGAKKVLTWLEKDEENRAASLDEYAGAFLTKDGDIRKHFANKPIVEKDPDIDRAMRVEAARMKSVQERCETLETVQMTESLLTLSLKMTQAYDAKKTAQAVLDYDDLISATQRLLARPDVGPWVLFKLDGGIDHILVDESQDTSPAQWNIIRRLADEYFTGESARSDRERTLFVVGDEKQSIYSFLKADPEEFSRMRDAFEAKIAACGKRLNKVPLNVSFRSAPAILRAVDAVFAADAVRQGVSEVPVTHKAFRADGEGRVEVWPLFLPLEDQQTGKGRITKPEDWTLPLQVETVHNPVAALAEATALQIKAWLESGAQVYDRALKTSRTMTPSDVMVIVAKRKPFVDHFVRAIKAVGVPVSGVDRMRLTQQLAVMDIIALLQFALLPEDSLTLATVLRGPLIGASEEDLMALAIGRTGTLWQSLCQKREYETWCDYLQSIAALADQISPLQLISHILSGPCPMSSVSGRRAIAARLGPDAEDPLDELLNEAEAFSARHSPSLQAFLHWLMSTEAEIKREMEQAAGRVRVTTVHSSKGLEAPVVILPDTARPPERRRIPKILWDEKERLPLYLPRDCANAQLRSLRNAAYEKQLEENRRLMYVALTRAADRLYIGGFLTKKPSDKQTTSSENWYRLIEQGLKDHHQDDVIIDKNCILKPAIVLADYARGNPMNPERVAPLPNPPRKGEGTAPVIMEAGGDAVNSEKVSNSVCRKEPSDPLPLAGRVREGGQEEGAAKVPPWLFAPPPPEPSPPRPLVPSRPESEEPPSISPQDRRFARGRIIHRLLQSLPEIEEAKRECAARRFLANPQHALEAVAQAEICAEVMGLLRDPRFAPLFGPQSRAELPIVGLSGERLIAGQVDRLALVGGEVWIIDYKTNRPPPKDSAHIPEAYRGQMEAYRTVLGAIYPENNIRCFLLWTYTLALMEVLTDS